MLLGYQCANSGHDGRGRGRPRPRTTDELRGRGPLPRTTWPRWSSASTPPRAPSTRLEKRSPTTPRAAYPSASSPTAATAPSTGPARHGLDHYVADQRQLVRRLLGGRRRRDRRRRRAAAAVQQAVRYNLFSLAQASARTDGLGVPAKGMTGSGYEGHYFWDTEVYVIPFLTYTAARGRPQRAALPLRDAARRPRAGPRDGAERRALPLADHQRRGGVGVLRGRLRRRCTSTPTSPTR